MESLDHLSFVQVLGLLLLVGVLCWAWAHYHASAKATALVAAARAEFKTVEKRVEDYTDAEAEELFSALLGRLSDTSSALQAKASADAVIARKTALVARVQAVASAATVKTA